MAITYTSFNPNTETEILSRTKFVRANPLTSQPLKFGEETRFTTVELTQRLVYDITIPDLVCCTLVLPTDPNTNFTYKLQIITKPIEKGITNWLIVSSLEKRGPVELVRYKDIPFGVGVNFGSSRDRALYLGQTEFVSQLHGYFELAPNLVRVIDYSTNGTWMLLE